MKWVIYIVLLANLAMFVWHYQGTSSSVGKQDDQDSNVPKLVLLSEFLQDERLNADVSTANNEKKKFAVVPHCYRIGPMDSKRSADQAVADLRRHGIFAKTASRKDSNKAGYWVFIPQHNTRQSAKRSISKLKGNGEKDYFLVASGEFKNAISLGLYSKRHLAKVRLEKITEMGFSPALKNVNLPKSLYWVEWERDPENAMSRDVFINMRNRYENIGQIEIQCKA